MCRCAGLVCRWCLSALEAVWAPRAAPDTNLKLIRATAYVPTSCPALAGLALPCPAGRGTTPQPEGSLQQTCCNRAFSFAVDPPQAMLHSDLFPYRCMVGTGPRVTGVLVVAPRTHEARGTR